MARGGWEATVRGVNGRCGIADVAHNIGEGVQTVLCLHRLDGSHLITIGSPLDLLYPVGGKPVIKNWPTWAKSAAMDEIGRWHWADCAALVATPHDGQWTTDRPDGSYRAFHPSEVPEWKGHWLNSAVYKNS